MLITTEKPQTDSRYRHYKGGEYIVLFVGKHSETMEEMVVYQNIEHKSIWCRPLAEWNKPIEGKPGVKRFEEIKRKKISTTSIEFACPNCGSCMFGSSQNEDGSLTRQCHGNEKHRCSFSFHDREDWKYFHQVTRTSFSDQKDYANRGARDSGVEF